MLVLVLVLVLVVGGVDAAVDVGCIGGVVVEGGVDGSICVGVVRLLWCWCVVGVGALLVLSVLLMVPLAFVLVCLWLSSWW